MARQHTDPPPSFQPKEFLQSPFEAKEEVAQDNIAFNRWAVVIGISEYKYSFQEGKAGIAPLKYAHKDAEAFADMLTSPECGSFQREQIKLLTNQNATTRNIIKALRGFLKKPGEESLAIIYISGHGAPDADRPHNRYFLTYDTEPEDIPGTALHMSEIKQCIDDTLLAQRVLVFADTCHSGASIGGSGRKSAGQDDEAKILQRLLDKEISQSKPGIAWFTSSSGAETSQESEQWALEGSEGHGVFTHFLLKGMKGAADGFDGAPKTGRISVNQLFSYVKRKVEHATQNKQHPVFNIGDFSVDMAIAYTGGKAALDHFELGKSLMKLAEEAKDPDRYVSAVRHFMEARHLSVKSGELPDLNLWLGKACHAAGDLKQAQKFFELEKDNPEAQRRLGLLHYLAGEEKKGLDILRKVKQPDTQSFVWLGERLAKGATDLMGLSGGHKKTPAEVHAVIIGIDTYLPPVPALQACVSDALKIKDLFESTWNNRELRFHTLFNEDATKKRIRETVKKVSREIRSGDMFILVFVGHSVNDTENHIVGYEEEFLIPYDGRTPGGEDITCRELHEWMQQIPAENKCLITDIMPLPGVFVDKAKTEGDYALLMAAQPGQMAKELRIEDVPSGVFTHALVKVLQDQEMINKLTDTEIEEQTREIMASLTVDQDPWFVNAEGFFLNWRTDISNQVKEMLRFVYGRDRQISGDQLNSYSTLFNRTELSPTQEVAAKFLHAAHRARDWESVISRGAYLLKNYPEYGLAHLDLIDAYLETEDFEAVLEHIDAWLRYERKDEKFYQQKHPHVLDLKKRVEEMIEDRPAGKKYALLVGVVAETAISDVDNWKKTLVEDLGFKAEHITVLSNSQDDGGLPPTRENILREFPLLVEKAITCPAFFFFAGTGSTTILNKEGRKGMGEMETPGDSHLDEKVKLVPTLLSADARQPGVEDIGLDTLAFMARDANHLTVLIEAGFDSSGDRYMPPDERPKKDKGPGWRPSYQTNEKSLLSHFAPDGLQIGNITILPGVKDNPAGSEPNLCFVADKKKGGMLSHFLGEAIAYHKKVNFFGKEIRSLVELAKPPEIKDLIKPLVGKKQEDFGGFDFYLSPIVLGDQGVRFSGYIHPGAAASRQIRLAPFAGFVDALRPLIEGGNQMFRESRADLAVALQLLGETDAALDELRRTIGEGKKKGHFPLGRILVEANQEDKESWSEAVHHLREAIELDPNNAVAKFYLGKAILGLMEREGLQDAETAFKQYLKMGAPIGRKDEVMEFLTSRDPVRQREAAVERGKKAMEERKYELSIGAFEEAIRLGDKDAQLQLAAAFEKSGNLIRALDAYTLAEKEGVEHGLLPFNVGWAIYHLMRDPDLLEKGLKALEEFGGQEAVGANEQELAAKIEAKLKALKALLTPEDFPEISKSATR